MGVSPKGQILVKNHATHGRDTRDVPDSQKLPEVPTNAELSAELEERISTFVRALVAKDDEQYESEFVHLLSRVDELVDRKLRMEGTKTDTRDFLGELIFTRMRRGMHLFMRSEDTVSPTRAAEWVMGVLFSVTTLSEFAKAFDQSLIRANSGGQDFNFAGRTDFISVEEVLQMLASGKHLGCLSLEKMPCATRRFRKRRSAKLRGGAARTAFRSS